MTSASKNITLTVAMREFCLFLSYIFLSFVYVKFSDAL